MISCSFLPFSLLAASGVRLCHWVSRNRSPAAASASIFDLVVSSLPMIIAPACPTRFSGGTDLPAMQATRLRDTWTGYDGLSANAISPALPRSETMTCAFSATGLPACPAIVTASPGVFGLRLRGSSSGRIFGGYLSAILPAESARSMLSLPWDAGKLSGHALRQFVVFYRSAAHPSSAVHQGWPGCCLPETRRDADPLHAS